MTMEERYWLVWNPQTARTSFKHPTEHSATTEAERLARLNPGEMFVVLTPVSARKVDDMQIIKFGPTPPSSEPPF